MAVLRDSFLRKSNNGLLIFGIDPDNTSGYCIPNNAIEKCSDENWDVPLTDGFMNIFINLKKSGRKRVSATMKGGGFHRKKAIII